MDDRKNRRRPETLEQVTDYLMEMDERLTGTVERVEVAMIGQWNKDGTYSEGFIQKQARFMRTLTYLAGLGTAVLTGLLIFAAENSVYTHTHH